jgi:hypothetical protein
MPNTVITVFGLGACVDAARSEAGTEIGPAHLYKICRINDISMPELELSNWENDGEAAECR